MGKWISVKDRLPAREGLQHDETEYVLVVERTCYGACWVGVCGYDKDGWSEWDSFGVLQTKRITHWMPMPLPPEEAVD